MRALFLCCLLACSRNTVTEPPIGPDKPRVVDATPVPATAQPPPPPSAVPSGCTKDDDCGYDDMCMAKTCVLHPPMGGGCDKSMIPTFNCRCNPTTHACEKSPKK